MARAVAAALALLSIALLAPPAGAWDWQCFSSVPKVCQLVPPLTLRAEPAPDGIHLSWQASPDPLVDEYRVHRIATDGQDQVVHAGPGTSYVDVPDGPGIFTYRVKGVRSVDQAETLPSNPAVAAWPYCQPVSVLPVDYTTDCLFPLPAPDLA